MHAQPNCYADVLRSTTQDSDGDDVSAGTAAIPVYRKVPFSILQKTVRSSSYASLEPRSIRITVGRCNGNLELQEDDQVFDITHRRLYEIIELSRNDSVIAQGEWVLSLQRTTGGATTP